VQAPTFLSGLKYSRITPKHRLTENAPRSLTRFRHATNHVSQLRESGAQPRLTSDVTRVRLGLSPQRRTPSRRDRLVRFSCRGTFNGEVVRLSRLALPPEQMLLPRNPLRQNLKPCQGRSPVPS
jgi:hypothetical protein